MRLKTAVALACAAVLVLAGCSRKGSSTRRLAFVTNYGTGPNGNTLSVIDIPGRKELHRVDIAPLTRPHGVFDGLQLLRNGRSLVFHIARARTPMPKSTREFIERCEFYRQHGRCPPLPTPLPG